MSSSNVTGPIFVQTGSLIGIGTYTPQAPLHVVGNVSASAFLGTLTGTASIANTASFLPVGSYNVTSSWANNALTSSQGSTAWGTIWCIGGSNFTSSVYNCSITRPALGSWAVTFINNPKITTYQVGISGFSGSASKPTASVAFSLNQTLSNFSMSFFNVASPLVACDFATASFDVNSY